MRCTGSLDTLTSVIRQFSTLEEFDLTCCPSNIKGSKELIEALAGHAGLRKISYQGISIGRDGFVAIATLLQNPLSNLTYLVLKDNSEYSDNERIIVDDEEARILSSGLNKNNSLTDLTLSGNHIGQRGWRVAVIV